MDPALKHLLNSLKCPICKAPVDIATKRILYQYTCAAEGAYHYGIRIDSEYFAPFLVLESVYLHENNRCYQITNNHFKNSNSTTLIQIYDTDPEGRILFNFKETKLELDKCVFDFRNFNIDKAIHRIKTIFVFQ